MMDQTTNQPIYSAQEARSLKAFSALMWALSYPGRTQVLSPKELTGDSHNDMFLAIAESLLNHDPSNSTYFTPDRMLTSRLQHTNAKALSANRAVYHFYPAVSVIDLYHIAIASGNDPLYPDQSVTLCLGCIKGSVNSRYARTALALQGSGTQRHQISFSFSGVPGALWSLREERNAQSTGWDIFLIDGDGKLICIPRDKQVYIERLDE